MRQIQLFYENLPVTEELDFDEANTIPAANHFLDRSNLFFPDGLDAQENRHFDMNKIIPRTLKDIEKSHTKKTK